MTPGQITQANPNTDNQFKRYTAYKFRIGDLLIGKPILDQERFQFLELGNQKINRINIVGNIVDKYNSEGEKKYCFFKLDDGSGQISLKSFDEEQVKKFTNITQGLTVVVIGTLRHWNNETYIQPEIIKEQDPKYLLVRKLELEKQRNDSQPAPQEKQEITAIKDKILDKIKTAEPEGGIEVDKIILELRETTPEIINQEIKKLLEEGIIFEPRPGKLRWLG